MKFKPGDYVHIGYCRAKIIRESEYKGYAYLVKLEPTIKDPIGARRMYGRMIHVSYKVADLDFKEINDGKA